MGSTKKLPSLCLLLVAACSGAKETELFGPAPQSGGGATPIGGSTEDGGGASAPDGGATPSDTGSSGSGSTAGASSSNDAGATPPPSAPCTTEVEPNNEADRATEFVACIDGTLKKSDVDFAEIVAPAKTTKIAIHHEETGGKVSYRLTINGMPLSAFTGDAPDYIPAVTSATYRFQIQMSGSGSATRTYRLAVSFE